MYGEGLHIKIFAGSTGRSFAKKMCNYLDEELGRSETITFSDGNTFVRILEPIRDKNVFIVQPIALKPNDEFVELLFWIDAFKRSSANSVTAIIPYFSYAKGDKKDEPRVSIRARVCAETIELAGVDRVVTMDLHSAQVQGFFKKPTDHLYAKSLLCEYIKRMGLVDDDLVVLSPDAGFAKRARLFASELGTPVAIGDKVRAGHDENARVLEIIGEVKGKNCLIVDDFSTSGGTVANAAKAVVEKGAKHVYCCLCHNLMNEKAIKRIENSPVELLVTTDSVDNPHLSPLIHTISVAPLFAETAHLIHSKEPLSPLFDRLPKRLLEMCFAKQMNLLE